MPAAMPSTANPVVAIGGSFMLSNGKTPVRINHRPSKIAPRFLPAKLFVSAILSPFSMRCPSWFSVNASSKLNLAWLTRSLPLPVPF